MQRFNSAAATILIEMQNAKIQLKLKNGLKFPIDCLMELA